MINNFKKFGLIVVLLFLAVGFSGCKKSDNAKVDNSSSDEQVAEEVEDSKDKSNEKKEGREYFAIARDIEKRFGIDDGFYARLFDTTEEVIKKIKQKNERGDYDDFISKFLINDKDSSFSLDIEYKDSLEGWNKIVNKEMGFEFLLPKGVGDEYVIQNDFFSVNRVLDYTTGNEKVYPVHSDPIFLVSKETFSSLDDFFKDDDEDIRKENYVGDLILGDNKFHVIAINVESFLYILLGKNGTFAVMDTFFNVNGIDPQVFYEILKSYKEI